MGVSCNNLFIAPQVTVLTGKMLLERNAYLARVCDEPNGRRIGALSDETGSFNPERLPRDALEDQNSIPQFVLQSRHSVIIQLGINHAQRTNTRSPPALFTPLKVN